MKMYDATEAAYRNGYKQGFADAQGATTKICKNCVCQPVCCVFNATGGVATCEYKRMAHDCVVYATKLPADEAIRVELTNVCSRCGAHMLAQDNVCPGCGSIMMEDEQECDL